MGKHKGKVEAWIAARALVNRGWLPMPRHAHGGRHADTRTRRGAEVAGRVVGWAGRAVSAVISRNPAALTTNAAAL